MSMTLNSLTNATGSPPSIANAGSPKVAQTTDTGLVQTAVGLSSDASVIATLGVPGVNLQTYNAAGLLNQLVQSGTAPVLLPVPAAGTDTQNLSQQVVDQGVVNTLATSSVGSGVYTSSGTLQNAGLSSNWASVLKSAPDFASIVAADSFAQGIIGTINTTA